MEYLPNFLSRAHAAEDAVDGSDIAHYRVYYGSDVEGNVNTERFDPNIKITFDRSDENSTAEAQAELYDVIRKKDTVRRASWLGASLGGAALISGAILGVNADQPSRSDTTPVASGERGTKSPQHAQKQITLNQQASPSSSLTPSPEPSPSQGPPRIKIVEKEVPVPVEGPTVYITESVTKEPQPHDSGCYVINNGETIATCPDGFQSAVKHIKPQELETLMHDMFSDIIDLFNGTGQDTTVTYAINTKVAAIGNQAAQPVDGIDEVSAQERLQITARFIQAEKIGFATVAGLTTTTQEKSILMNALNADDTTYGIFPGSGADSARDIIYDTDKFAYIDGQTAPLTGTNGKLFDSPVLRLKDVASDQEFFVVGFWAAEASDKHPHPHDHQTTAAAEMNELVAQLINQHRIPVYLVGDAGNSPTAIACSAAETQYLESSFSALSVDDKCVVPSTETNNMVLATKGSLLKEIPLKDSATFGVTSDELPKIVRLRLPANTPLPDVPPSFSTEPETAPISGKPFEIVIAQSNEYVRLSPEKFKHDLKIILSHEPHIITFNEMIKRSASLITPKGYDMWRGNDNDYMKGTPVLWREDTWQPAREYKENRGTIMTSIAPHMKWATTAANWVTLEHADGHVVSVISAHLPPFPHVSRDRRELYREAIQKLNELVGRLSERGEVVLAGDMNTHFQIDTNRRKKGDQGKLHPLLKSIRKSGLISTYEPTTNGGESNEPIHGWGTGNKGKNGTIDYVFTLKNGALELKKQLIEERTLSDHDAVVATYTYRPTQNVSGQ